MTHGHRQRAVGARRGGQPLVGELDVVGVVGRHDDDLLAAVAGLGHPVGVGRARDGDVGAPHHEVAGVPPVAGLGHVGLVAPDLRRGHRQVGVPVVEREHRPADERGEPGPRGVADHRHRRDGGEAGHAVGAPLLDGVHVGGGDDLGRLAPRGPHQPALAAGRLVPPGLVGVSDDVGPGEHGVTEALLGLAVHLEEDAADVGVANPGGGVGVPGERRTARAAAGLVLGPVGTRGRVVGLLRLPRDDAVLDVDLPRAGAGAVDAVRGAHHLVVAPAVAVEAVARPAALGVQAPSVVGDLGAGEEPPGADEGLRQWSVQSCCAARGARLVVPAHASSSCSGVCHVLVVGSVLVVTGVVCRTVRCEGRARSGARGLDLLPALGVEHGQGRGEDAVLLLEDVVAQQLERGQSRLGQPGRPEGRRPRLGQDAPRWAGARARAPRCGRGTPRPCSGKSPPSSTAVCGPRISAIRPAVLAAPSTFPSRRKRADLRDLGDHGVVLAGELADGGDLLAAAVLTHQAAGFRPSWCGGTPVGSGRSVSGEQPARPAATMASRARPRRRSRYGRRRRP